jgi:hypothetical protein
LQLQLQLQSSLRGSKPTDADEANGNNRYLDLIETFAGAPGDLTTLPHCHPADGYAWPPYRPVLALKLSDIATEVERRLTAE